MHRLSPGFLLSSRYRLTSLVAAGGMGQVWAGVDEALDRKVALKVMKPTVPGQRRLAERFAAEARLAARISHPNIVEVFDFGRHLGLAYLVMEFIEGPTLAQLLAADGRLHPDQARSILLQLAAALARAHENDVIHRDLKPSNVMVSADGLAKLTDFGIAQDASGGQIAPTDVVLGSAHYLSPEHALGGPVTTRSDLYSFGVLAYELLAGEKPFRRPNPLATALAHVDDPPPALPPEVPDDLVHLIAQCLQKRPDDRPGSATDVVQALSLGEPPAEPLLVPGVQLTGAGTSGLSKPPDQQAQSPTQPWAPVW